MSGVTLEIRRYSDDDQSDVLRLHNEALDEIAGAHAGDGPWDQDLSRIREEYIDACGDFLIGVLAGEIVAMGALSRTDDQSAEIRRMRVRPSHWRRGYGQAILSALEERARELGYHRLHLDTARELEAAQELYRKNGYKEVGRVTQFGHECIEFEKMLELSQRPN